MPEPLVIVSNRGPVGFRRASGALEHDPRRRRSRHARCARSSTATRCRGWRAPSSDGRPRGRGGGRAYRAARRRRRRSDSTSSSTTRRSSRRFYGVVANPVLWFVQHGLWDLKHDPDADLGEAWAHGYVEANRALAAPPSKSSTGGPRHLSSSTTTTSTSCRRSSGRRDRRRASRTSSTSRGSVRPTGRCCPARSPAPSTRASSRATASASTPSAGGPRSSRAARRSSRRGDEAEERSHANPIAVDADELESLARSPAVQERRRDLLAVRPEILVLRVDRTDPVEERRPRLRGLRAAARARAGAPRVGSSWSRCSIPRGRRFPSTWTTGAPPRRRRRP